MAIDTNEIERRWQEVVNKDLGNDYFPHPMMLSEDMESSDNLYEFNVEMLDSSLNDKYLMRIYNEDLSKATMMLIPDMVTLADGPSPLFPPSENKLKVCSNLEKEGDNWVGLYLMNKDQDWAYFNWYLVFKDSKLKLSSDKYTISPGETATIETYLESGIDYPDPTWTVDYDSISHMGKTYTFSSEELGNHIIEARHSLFAEESSIIIKVDSDDDESEYPIIEESQTNDIDGTYSCSFTLVSATVLPYLPYDNPSQSDIDRANENVVWLSEDYQSHVGEVTNDENQFYVRENEDGTYDVSFSPFLGYQLGGMTGGENVPLEGESLHWTSDHNNNDYDIVVTFSATEDGVEMKGTATYMSYNLEWVTKVLQIFEFEGEKIN